MNLSVSYLVMVIGILCAKCLGFVRESVVAGKFGASSLTDIYFQVFSVANVVFAAVGVSLSILVVKSINASACKNERGFMRIFIKKVLKYSVCAAVILACLGRPITSMLLPGLSENDFYIALKLYYIMLPTLIFIVLAYTLNGILQNKGKFFVTAVLSVPFNIIIIGSLLLGVENIYTFGIVTTLGWAAQFLFLLPSYFKTVKDTGEVIEDKASVFKGSSMTELIFIIVSNLVFQLLFVMDKASVSGNDGISSAIHYSSYLFTTVSGIFLAGMSAVFFPSLTKSINERDEERTNSLIRYTLTFMFAVFTAFLMVSALYGRNIIALLYERGSFTAEDSAVVSGYFKIYSLCIFGYITQELLFKIFYAKNSYKTTVVSALTVIFANLICDFIFKDNPFFVVLSTAVICCVFAMVMFVVLAKEHKDLFNGSFVNLIFKILCSSMSFPLFYMIFNMRHEAGKGFFIIPVIIGAAVYLAALWRFKVLKEIFFYKNERN